MFILALMDIEFNEVGPRGIVNLSTDSASKEVKRDLP
jgi:hypothetical protein